MEIDVKNLLQVLINIYEMIKDHVLPNTFFLMADQYIPKEIIKRKDKGEKDYEIQFLVKLWYEDVITDIPNVTKDFFVRYTVGSFLYGDIARINEEKYGKENCEFVASSIAIWGGFNSFEEVD